MALDFATSYAEIIKFNKNDDGTITVYGKATSDDLDIDQQICDNDWLSKAMPEWFKSGGNIREQHSSIAAGVAHELETKDDGYYVSAHIVDPTSIKKVEAKVLKGFSIGIKGPRVVRDNKAANGRIIDGQIVEVSLVDRPANPTCQLVLAKSVGGESTLTQVEDLIEKYNPDQERDERGRFGSGGGGNDGGPGGTASIRSVEATRLSQQVTKTNDNLLNYGVKISTDPDILPADKLDAAQIIEDASGHLMDAQSSLDTAAQTSDTALGEKYASRAEDSLNRASEILEASSNMGLANYGRLIDSHAEDVLNFYSPPNKSTDSDLSKYNENQERDERGRFGSGGGGGSDSNSSGGTSDGRDNKAIQDLAVNVTEHTDDISEIVTEAEDGVGSPLRGNDQELADQAQNLIDSAATLLDQASDSTVGNGSHYTMLERASSKLDDAATSLLNANNRGLNNVGKDIQGTVDQIDSYLENMANNVKAADAKKSFKETIEKYNENQERDERGRFGSGGKSASSSGTPRTEDHDKPNMGNYHGSDKIENNMKDARSLSQSLSNNPNDTPARDSAKKDIETARGHLQAAYNANTVQEARGFMRSALTATNHAFNTLEEHYPGEAESAHQLAVSITTSLVAIKSADAEKFSKETIEKYNENQERDDHGRFGSGGGGSNNDQPVGRDAKTAINRQKNEIQNARMKTVKDEYTAQGHKDVQSAERYLARAGKAETVGQATQLIGQARTAIDRAIGVFEDQNYHDTAGTLYNAGKELNSLSVGMGTGVIKSASVALQYNFTNKSDKDYETMKNALLESIVEMEKSVAGDKVKFDQASYDVARRGIAQLIISEAGEIAETDSDERDDIGTLLSALKHLFNFRDGELDEDQDAVSDMAGSIAGSMINLAADGDSKGCDCDGCAACQSDGGCDSDICKGCKKMSAKSAKIDKCLECGCHDVSNSHGLTQVVIPGATPTNEVANVTTATSLDTSGSIKSAEGEEVVAEDKPAEEKADELVDAELPTSTEILDEKSVSAIIEKAVKSATDTVKAEIAEYEAASKAAEQKVMALESELVAAKSAARSGGPKRTGRSAPTDTNELLLKAAEYRLKASATSDQILAKGYKALEKEYLAKAGTPDAE